MKRHGIEKIIAIPEDVGLFVCDDVIEAIGPNVITLFDRDSKRVVQKGVRLTFFGEP